MSKLCKSKKKNNQTNQKVLSEQTAGSSDNGCLAAKLSDNNHIQSDSWNERWRERDREERKRGKSVIFQTILFSVMFRLKEL